MTKTLVRLVAVLTVALCTGACSTFSDMIGDDDASSSAPPADATGFPPDATPASAESGGTAPDLAAIPDKPSGTTNPDDQRETADSLAADAARSRYSAEALRGGTEAAAAPPLPPGAAVASVTPPAPQPSPPAIENSDDSAPAPSPAPTVRVASAPAPSVTGAQPAVPPLGDPSGLSPTTTNATLGFRPSSAPPLDPSISQFVAQPIIARYQETATSAGVAIGPINPMNAGPPAPQMHAHIARNGQGGPETMSGSVVANLDVLDGPASASVYANAVGGPPQAVVLFPDDGMALTATGRARIREAVDAFQQRGGTGFIKVVGHSSSRTANMPVEKHLLENFTKSQARANAVAREIIRDGIPASRVLVEAVGDSQPVYFESMPEGEVGNRRAEIFIQG